MRSTVAIGSASLVSGFTAWLSHSIAGQLTKRDPVRPPLGHQSCGFVEDRGAQIAVVIARTRHSGSIPTTRAAAAVCLLLLMLVMFLATSTRRRCPTHRSR
jgi:hypothetical protein